MKRRELPAHLEAQGCVRLLEGGRHTIFRNPTGNLTAPVPRHREIDRVLAVRICRELGLAPPAGL